jgi:16S rRNA (guanine527-N7)-methyltransferase
LPSDGRFLDLGSGGGIPGLILAVDLPASRWLLLDANQRRTAFLQEAVDVLRLGERVEVLRARAEEAGRDPHWRHTFAAVCARSFAPPAVTAECASPFLIVGGRLIVSEPPETPETPGRRWPEPSLAELGLGLVKIGTTSPRLAVLRQEQSCPDRYPRRMPAKRPLW